MKQKWNTGRRWLLAFGLSVFYLPSGAQNIDYNSKLEVILGNSTTVILYAQLQGSGSSARPSKNYYYLPAMVQLARDPVSGVPEFLFLKYISEQREDQGGVSGALLHFLMQTGFSKEQLAEMQSKVAAKISGAQVKGPIDLFPASDANTFTITSAVVNSGSSMTKSLVTTGKAPLQQGGKVAVAANLDKNGAQLLAATFEKTSSITDLSVNLFYKYFLKVNGLKAKFTIDYVKMQEVTKRDKVDGVYRYDYDFWDQSEETQTWTEIHTMYERMLETKAITIEIEQNMANATSDKITEALFQLFLSLVATPATDKPSSDTTGNTQPYLPGRNKAYDYHLNIIRRSVKQQKKKDVVYLNYDYNMPMEYSMTQNLKTFYDAARNNPKCLGSVVLGDVFYKHMDIRFVLDLEAKEMFDQEVNFVTVSARRRNSSGGGYRDLGSVTIDKAYTADKGITALITYPAIEETNKEIYEYKTQWSLRGGNVYPADPAWQKGQMQALTLKPPVTPRLLEFEADLENMKAAGIRRITLQVRYKKFDQEMEENLAISPALGQALVNKMIFMDRDIRGYAYRLVFNHESMGKLALPWSAQISDNYVFAVIPPGLIDTTSETYIKAVAAAKTIVAPATDGKVTEDQKVLDQFKDVLAPAKSN